MSRRGRGNVEHSTASKAASVIDATKQMPAGVSRAIDAVKGMNEPTKEEPAKPVPSELRDLVLFGKVVEDVRSGGYTFKLSTLSNRQQKQLVKRLVKLDPEERLINVKEFTLAYAIKSINNAPLEDLFQDSKEGLTVDDIRAEVVSDFQSALVDRLFDRYEGLVKKSNSLFEEGDLGEQVKN